MEQDPISDIAPHFPQQRRESVAMATGRLDDQLTNEMPDVVLTAMGQAAAKSWAMFGMKHATDTWLWEYADGMNTYQYEMSNPLNGNDPSGLANTAPGKNGGICYLPCTQDRLTCLSNCIEENDPLNLLAKGLLQGIGGPIPKSLVRAFGGRTTVFGGGASPITTPGSIYSNGLGLPARNPIRTAGSLGAGAWMVYAYYMLGVETHCAGACAGDPCAY